MRKALFKNVKLLLLDVDGIMTDGSITYTNTGDELKSFSTKDGLGIRLLVDSGIHVGVVTARESKIVEKRCLELGISPVFQNIKNKAEVFDLIKHELNITKEDVCYMGDDLIDIPLLNISEISVTVPEACDEVKKVSDYITIQNGGKGAVREVCEKILKDQEKWETAILKYTKKPEPDC